MDALRRQDVIEYLRVLVHLRDDQPITPDALAFLDELDEQNVPAPSERQRAGTDQDSYNRAS